MIKNFLCLSIKFLITTQILCGLALGNISKEPTIFKEGEHFKKLSFPHKDLNQLKSTIDDPASSAKHPEIIVFFNYGCYGCWLLHTEFNLWLKSKNNKINVKYYPGSFNEAFYKLAKLYYVNQELKVYTDQEIFNEIHGKPHKALWLEQELLDFYSKKNISRDQFLQLFNSFHIDRKTKNTIEIAKIYNINLTPNVIINFNNDNSYMVNLSMVNDLKSLFEVIEYLIKFNN